MKLNVYGQLVEIIRKDEKWIVFYLGNEGKKRLAQDMVIPNKIKKDALTEYLSDLCHEWSRPGNSKVRLLK